MKKTTIIFIILILIVIITSIIYNTFPRLQLNGSKNMIISYRDKYEEPGVIVKNATGNYMSKIKIDNNIDNKTIGNYYVDYSLKLGGKTLQVRRNVKVIDDVSPVIKLKGDQIIEISINSKYEEPGFAATDEYDGELTDKVEIIGEVNTQEYGEYVIKYKVTDNSSNTTEVNRIIKVIDEIEPTIECKNNYSAFKTGSINIIGCEATDNFDGDLTNLITVSGEYDVNEPGIYKIKYKVSDNAGNKTSIEHNIIIYNEKQSTAYLTFNNSPTSLTDEILEILNEYQIKSTFFVSLEQKEEYYKQLNKILENGNELGIIGYHQTENIYKNSKTFKSYFEETEELIYNKTGKKITSYRFPETSNSKKLNINTFNKIKEYLNNKNIIYYDWNIEPTNPSNLNITYKEMIEKTITQILNNESNEIVINFYDTEESQATIESLSTIIELLKEMNYEFDTINNSTPIQIRN